MFGGWENENTPIVIYKLQVSIQIIWWFYLVSINVQNWDN